ncbi:response regulator [Paenibacillus sp. KS-LC4]|uniref:response regulator transcription factor n=1 Tax=Paenibacillus sp. KS-LC4 TaxID=2979727 RepID=UPI0030CC3D1B
MRILVVDDEPFFIDELKRIIEKFRLENGKPLVEIAESYSGEQALLHIQSTRPDVVFTDIRMSSIDGLELAQTIQNNWPDLPVIIVSGYPSFDYAREAIRAQVMEYLLKPIDEKAMNLLLHNLYRKHEARKREEISIWLQKVLDISNPDDHIRWQKSSPNSHEHFIIALMRTHEYMIPNPENHIWVVSTNKWDYLVFVGLTKEDSFCSSVEPTPLFLNMVKKPELMSFLYTPDPVGIDCLTSAIESLYQQLDLRKIIGYQLHSSLLPIAAPPAWKEREDRLQYLINLAASKKAQAFGVELQKLFEEWNHEMCNNHIVERSLKYILFSVAKYVPSWTSFTLHRLNKQIEEIIVFANRFEEAREAFSQMLSPLFPNTAEVENVNDDSSLYYQKVIDYITTNLSEPLTLNDICEKFEASRTSVWSMFRQYGQTTFVEYLTNKRIEKAKQLIQQNDTLKLKDIAVQVGYIDHHYFSRIFKSVTGQTPSEYRMRNQ